VGHGLRVIAGARRDDAATPLLGAQVEQPVERAAVLEGAGALEALELEPDFAGQRIAEAGRGDTRRADDAGIDPLARGADLAGADQGLTAPAGAGAAPLRAASSSR